MSGLPRELRDLIESGPMAHLSTINADGSPQVSVIWIGLDGDEIVSGHMQWYAKLRNIERDPRVVLSFVAPRMPGVFLNPYAVLHARAAIEPGDDAWNLLDRLTKVYIPRTTSSRRRRVPAISCATPSSASAASAHGLDILPALKGREDVKRELVAPSAFGQPGQGGEYRRGKSEQQGRAGNRALQESGPDPCDAEVVGDHDRHQQ